MVSPNVLNLSSNGGSFSIHADINFNSVEDVSLSVGEVNVPISSTFADSRGDLVVKCNIETVKSMVFDGDIIFTLSVITLGGEYTGSDMIRVISCGE